jgi:adenine-specific DNA-methyltransferase
VKCIYIDPPYNTGNDFVYKDNFAEGTSAYWEQTGVTQNGVKMSTNTRADGRFHSNWLSMIYPRLLVARQLLREDGVIFVSIDDNEVTHLRKVMDEVFGEECWIGTIIWRNVTDNNPTNIAIEHESIVCYARSKSELPTVWKSENSDIKQKLQEIGDELISQHSNQADLENVYKLWFNENKKFLGPLDRYKYIDKFGVYTGSQSVHNPGREGY